MIQHQVIIIGGGPAGMAAAIGAVEEGAKDVLIIERDHRLGGILNQCIHNGFGLHRFKEELTGPEYASRFAEMVEREEITYKLDTMAMDISEDGVVTYINETEGMVQVKGQAIVLAMGCRERSRGAINIPGYRPAGIYSAGSAQHLVNIEGLMPGKEIVILGSGDIGLIMARRMTLEGGNVKAVCELLPYSGGLKRNIVQCLDDFNIPLLLSHTIVKIHGEKRLEGVTIAKVDEKRAPIAGTEEFIKCDTLLLSVGLIPENELSEKVGVNLSPITSGPVVDDALETSNKGIFACGNVLHVHDLVDFVSEEGEAAGRNAAKHALGKLKIGNFRIGLKGINGVRYTVPSYCDIERLENDLTVSFRVGDVYTNRKIVARAGDNVIFEKKRRHMAPGEMEKIQLPVDALKALTLDEITIGVEEA